MKIAAVVPAYNEEGSIYRVVRNIKDNYPFIDVIVVNDGSCDGTSSEAEKSGALVINLPFNLGIGGAVQTGYLYALYQNYDIVVQVDGDGQHNPEDLKFLVEALVMRKADMIIGSRFLGDSPFKSSFLRRKGIAFFSKVISDITGKTIMDTTSGYRAVNKRLIREFSEYYPVDYPEVETIVYAIKKGYKVEEIPVKMQSRITGRSSITPFKSIYYMMKVTFAIIFQS